MNSHNPTSDDIQASDARARALYLLAVASSPLVIAGLLTLLVFVSGLVKHDDGVGQQSEFAQISSPAAGQQVGDNFEVTGVIDSIPVGEVVYLVERVDDHFWPKKKIGASPTSFKRQHNASAGQGYKYTIELLSVSGAEQKQIEQWYETGKKTGKYPGIKTFDAANVLANLRVIHR